MSGDDLDVIRKRSDRVERLDGRADNLLLIAALASADDVPDLLTAVQERDEQIAALQAQLEAVQATTALYETTTRLTERGEAFVYRLRSLLASAPSDALDRVKREAAADALEGMAGELASPDNGSDDAGVLWYVGLFRTRAEALREGATS